MICKPNRKATDMLDDLDLNKSDLTLSRMVWAIAMIIPISCELKSD